MGSGRAGPGRAGPGREYSDFSLKYERTRSARCARSLVIIHEAGVNKSFMTEVFSAISNQHEVRGRKLQKIIEVVKIDCRGE